jgi:hypothetical protein
MVNVTYVLTEYFAYSGIIVVIYMLGEKNKYFKMAYNRVFKRSVKSYDGSMLNDDSEEAEEVEGQVSESLNSGVACYVVNDCSTRQICLKILAGILKHRCRLNFVEF